MNMIDYEYRKKVYMNALQKYGFEQQCIVAIEEFSEAQKEICKALRGISDPIHLVEELADATIVLEEMRLFFGLNDEVCKYMDQKIMRLRERTAEK